MEQNVHDTSCTYARMDAQCTHTQWLRRQGILTRFKHFFNVHIELVFCFNFNRKQSDMDKKIRERKQIADTEYVRLCVLRCIRHLGTWDRVVIQRWRQKQIYYVNFVSLFQTEYEKVMKGATTTYWDKLVTHHPRRVGIQSVSKEMTLISTPNIYFVSVEMRSKVVVFSIRCSKKTYILH